MRVLILSHDKTLFREGSKSQARMAERGKICDSLTLVAPTLCGFQEIVIAPNVRAIPTNSRNRFWAYLDTKRIAKRVIKNEGVDLVVAQDPFEFGRIARCLAKKFHIAWQVELHGDFYSTSWWKWSSVGNFIRHYFGKRILKSALSIRAVSERIRQSLVFKLGITDARISVFPVETDVTKFLDAPPSPFLRHRYANFDFFLLAVGALAPVKNVGMQIRALAAIVKKHPKTALVVVGDGPEKSALERLAVKLRVAQNVVFAGAQSDLMPYYKSADVFMLTSYAEGWGRAVVEAMVSGLAVIMTDVGLAGEFLVNSRNGLVVPVGDTKALIAAIEKLMTDAALRRRLGDAAQEAARGLPTHEEALRTYKENWEQCLNNASPQ